MRIMIIRKADKLTESGTLPDRKVLAAMGQYMDEMGKAGILLGGEGLKPSSQGKRVKFKNGKPVVVDGPFTETKELIAGYSLIEVKSMDEAVKWASRWPLEDKGVELEVRVLYENEDFGEEFTPELRAQEDRLRADAAKRSAKKK